MDYQDAETVIGVRAVATLCLSFVYKAGISVEEWDDKKEDSMLSAVDRSISSASAGVTPEPDSIIFGLPSKLRFRRLKVPRSHSDYPTRISCQL